MNIEILETFLDGRDRYKKGETRMDVADEDGRYFCECGWARDLIGEVETAPRQENGEVRLDIRNSVIGNTTEDVTNG